MIGFSERRELEKLSTNESIREKREKVIDMEGMIFSDLST